MPVIGFHASHEQISPAQLLQDVKLAEEAGFDAAMCSDHIEPWSARQGHSGFAWSWLGAALATTKLRFGVVTAPGQRYHPAIIAHASATLADMFPGRFWMAPGSGEYINEHITGDAWPAKDERQQRLEESVEVIRRLHDGEEVTHRRPGHRGARHGSGRCRSPSRRSSPRPSAWKQRAARRTGRTGWSRSTSRRKAQGRCSPPTGTPAAAGKAVLQVHLSWAPTEQDAVAIAMDQWRGNVFAPPIPWDLPRRPTSTASAPTSARTRSARS